MIRETLSRRVTVLTASLRQVGVWKGGLSVIVANLLKRRGAFHERRLWLVDSFEGFGTRNVGQDEAFNHIHNVASVSDVLSTFRTTWTTKFDDDYVTDAVRVVQGFVGDAAPLLRAELGALALLRVDCDTYKCHAQTLCALYDVLAVRERTDAPETTSPS